MKFSYQWFSELVPGLAADPASLQRLITMKTAECEGVEAFGSHFANVVAARVLTVDPLPKGRNRAVKIDVGGRDVVVVCGAPNVRPGLLAPWVPPGTSLAGALIGRYVIEGVESEGMLASAAELGINRDQSGLLELSGISPGESLAPLAPDWIIEIDNKSLTHRPDLWGHFGMAREIAAITGRSVRDPVKPQLLPHGDAGVSVDIADYVLCPRYNALVVDNVTVGPSPLWLQARLESVGLNAINNIVDITNYILAELPQPMHAFDAEKLVGGTIFVRTARSGERLAALNGETYELAHSDLVIADASGPIALAGVIGGADTAISATTTRIVLESANFHPTNVRLTAARHKLRTDASMRFEKSLDPENTIRGLARAVELIQQLIPGARIHYGVADRRGPVLQSKPIALPVSVANAKIGIDVGEERTREILESLGFGVAQTAPGLLTVTVPSWRATKDIGLKDDLVEEIGRMIGYDEITPTAPRVACVAPPPDPLRRYIRQVKSGLTSQGLTEVYNYSFLNATDIEKFGLDAASHIAVQNPIAADLTHLRRSLIPGLFKNILSNARNYPEFRIFEIGNEIHPEPDSELPKEILRCAAAIYSEHGDAQYFFELKRVLECAFPGASLAATEALPYEHPARAAVVSLHGNKTGRFFELHPSLLSAEGVEGRAVFFDIDLIQAAHLAAAQTVAYTPLRKYPTSGSDLSVVADLRKPVDNIERDLKTSAGSDLASIEFIRQYTGAPLPAGQKSVSYHLEIGALDRTLTAEEVTAIRQRIIDGMRALGYDLRGLDS